MVYEAEFMLMAIAVGLYLYDSALLLYCNEGVVVPKGSKGWLVRFGSTVRLGGRELFIPSPLLPHRPVFRLAWSFEAIGGLADTAWTSWRTSFRPLIPMVWGMAASMFVLLPLGFFTAFGNALALTAIGLLYINIVAALAWLTYRRASFGLSPRRLAILAFECLLCSPFAVNLIRRVSSEMRVKEDLMAAARRLESPEDWPITRDSFVRRLQEELELLDEGSAKSMELKARLESLLQDPPSEACLQQKSS